MKRVKIFACAALIMCIALGITASAFTGDFFLVVPVYRRDAQCVGNVNGQTVTASEVLATTQRTGIDPPEYSCSLAFTVFDWSNSATHGYYSTPGVYYTYRTETLNSTVNVDAVRFAYQACTLGDILIHWLPESYN